MVYDPTTDRVLRRGQADAPEKHEQEGDLGDAYAREVSESEHRNCTHCLLRVPIVLAFSFAVFVAGTATAADLSQPSDRGCLLAWNAASNHSNRVKLIAARPMTGLSLRGGNSFTDTWTKGVPKQTSTEACLLTVAKTGKIQFVTGVWRVGHVSRWSWGHPILTTRPFFANVRLLSDGRVTKIYSH